jgi:hypothetical protein
MLEGSHRFSSREGEGKALVLVASGPWGGPMLRVASSFMGSPVLRVHNARQRAFVCTRFWHSLFII